MSGVPSQTTASENHTKNSLYKGPFGDTDTERAFLCAGVDPPYHKINIFIYRLLLAGPAENATRTDGHRV